jgi:hypothetical protein
VTRMADGLDISAYPTMDPELVAPVVGLLVHESCPITGEMLVSIAGRVARVVVAETPGVFRPSWSIEQVGARLDAIRDTNTPLIFPVVPDGHLDHLRYSFEMGRPATMQSAQRDEAGAPPACGGELGNRHRGARHA